MPLPEERDLSQPIALDFARPVDLERNFDLERNSDLGVAPDMTSLGFVFAQTIHRSLPGALVLGDFDSDGNLDAVTASWYVGELSFYHGLGDGHFATPLRMPTVASVSALAAADLDHDGSLDLVVVGWSDGGRVLRGHGDGTFTEVDNVPLLAKAANVVIGDFTGDGTLDVAIATTSPVVFVGRGDGTLNPPIVSKLAAGEFACLVSGDFDHDGRLDLAASSSQDLSIYFGAGDGEFSARTQYAIAGGGLSLAAADLDHDGAIDLVTDDSPVLWGHADGTFATRANDAIAVAPSALAMIADLDGDGWSDLVTLALDRVSSARNDQHGAFVNAQTSIVPTMNWPANGNLFDVALGDLNGDGRVDLVAELQPGLSSLLQKGDGAFAAPELANVDAPHQIFFADFDHDYTGDLLTVGIKSESPRARVAITLWRGAGDGEFALPFDFVGTDDQAFAGPIVVGDFNGDGRSDVIAPSATPYGHNDRVLFIAGTPQSTFDTPRTAWSGYFTPIAAADFNHDGRLDVIGVREVPIVLTLLLGNGDGTFNDHGPIATTASLDTWNYGYQFGNGAVDLNGDGALDLIIDDQYGFESLRGAGDGTFAAPAITSAAPQTGIGPLCVADFNSDGAPDIAMIAAHNIGGEPTTYQLQLALGHHDGTFSWGATLPIDGATAIDAADYDGDGRADLVVATYQTGELWFFAGNGDGSFVSPARRFASEPGFTAIARGDFDHDGRPDLAIAHWMTNNSITLHMNRFVH